jgi:hypothetical protein
MNQNTAYPGIHLPNRARTSAGTFLLAMGLVLGFGHAQTRAAAVNPLTINVTQLTVQDGQLLVSGVATLVNSAGESLQAPFTTLATLTTAPGANASCPVLNLNLQPIHLDLLGLAVDTSPICLDITAHRGGGLLGNLLCSVANLLQNGLDLNQILASLTRNQAGSLIAGLTQILSGALNGVLNNATVQSVNTAPTNGSCAVLNLALGPLDLNLLGLEVHLYNCDNATQPITVDVSAIPSSVAGGGLLGDLLCSLDSSLLSGLTGALQNVLGQLLAALGTLP